jgi:hypothetical protein
MTRRRIVHGETAQAPRQLIIFSISALPSFAAVYSQ